MKYDSISGLFTAIADEIRAKDGSSELINPQDLPERVKNLSGIPDVPTLECWKITIEDNDVKMTLVDELYRHDNRPLVFGTMDEDVYAGMYPIFGTGYPPEGVQSFYFLFFNTWVPEPIELLDFLSANGGEKIPLSTYLEVASTIIPR